MSTKIKINKSQINYQKLRQLFYDRVFVDGGIYEGDDELIKTLNKENTQGLKLLITPTAYSAGKFYSILPNDGTGDFTYTQNTANGTIINEQGNIETVPANTPRITWVNGVPELLVEESATNLIENSEDYSGGFWNKLNSTITPNDTFSIIKNELADRVVQNTGTIGSIITEVPVTNDSVTRCLSVYTKKETTNKFAIFLMRFTGGSSLIGTSIQINKKTGDYYTDLTNAGSGFTTPIDAGVIDEGDYWRVYISINNNSTNHTSLDLFFFPNRGVALNDSSQDDGDAVLAGIQVEKGTKPSSLIPTNGAIATRNDDVATVTPPAGTTEIHEYLADGTMNVITTIPATYQPAPGLYKYILMK